MISTFASSVGAPRPLRVLVADDDPEFRELVVAVVGRLGHSCVEAADGAEAFRMHQRARADVVSSDWEMPQMCGPELCRMIRGTDPPPTYTHLILLTGRSDRADFVEGMAAGADEYLTKPLDIDALRAQLNVACRRKALCQGLVATNLALRLAVAGNLEASGALATDERLHRDRLMGDLEALAGRARRYGHRYWAALCDIDGFEAYTACFGWLSGVTARRRISRAILDGLRVGDSLYAYRNETLLVILPEQSPAGAMDSMNRIRRKVEAERIPHAPREGAPFLTVSIGMAEVGDALVERWLDSAGLALRVARSRGRNQLAIETFSA